MRTLTYDRWIACTGTRVVGSPCIRSPYDVWWQCAPTVSLSFWIVGPPCTRSPRIRSPYDVWSQCAPTVSLSFWVDYADESERFDVEACIGSSTVPREKYLNTAGCSEDANTKHTCARGPIIG